MILEFLIRVLIAVTVLYFIFYENFDYKIPFLSLVIFYVSLFFLLSTFFKSSRNIRYTLLFIDTVFISIFVYLSSYPEIGLFILPLALNFTESKKAIFIASVMAVVPIFISVYISSLSEIAFLPLYIAFVASVVGIYRKIRNEKRFLDKIKSDMEDLYEENINLRDIIEKQKIYINLLHVSNQLLEKKLSLNSYLAVIFEYTTSKGVLFYDFNQKKCIAIGEVECKKDVPKYIVPGFNILENTKVNELLDTPFIVAVSIETNRHTNGFLLFCYEVFDEKETKLIKVINSYLKAYFVS